MMGTKWLKSFYVIYGDDTVFIKKRKYVLKPSEAVKLARIIGLEHFNVMKVESLAPFRARHLESEEKRALFEKWAQIYKEGGG